jgi:drug/metabolite transporter (DMT)-like permease
MGLFFAGLAIVGWGLGDFLIQRSARKLGDWEALFYITAFGAVALLPFVLPTLALLSPFDWLVLVGTSLVIFVAGLLDFEALRVGKMSVIEPIYAMEVPVTIALSTLLIGELLSLAQLVLVAGVLVGIFLVSNKHLSRSSMRTLERGVLVAVFATMGMGLANFLFGFAARSTTPIMINWFTSLFMAAGTLAYLVGRGRGGLLVSELTKNARLLFAMGLFDNMAWVAFSASTLYMPIGIATGLTESYIALAAILGLIYNGERLRRHQKLGLVLAVCAAVALAFYSA